MGAAVAGDHSVAAPSARTLWRDRLFRPFWVGEGISQFGDRISELALPLIAVVVLHASPREVAWLTALIWTPNLIALFLGTWVDRQRHKQRVMVAADLVRAATLLSLPAAYLLGAVTLTQLYAVALITGTASVFFNTAYPAFFAHLVPREAFLAANGALSSTRSASFVAGPAIGGVLVQALGAPIAVAADALSFIGSALLVGRIPISDPPMEDPSAADERFLRRVKRGLRIVLRDPVLRGGLLTSTTVNFFTFMSGGLLVLFASRTLGLSAGAIGLALGVGAVGGLLGAVAAPALSRRIGLGWCVALGSVVFPASVTIVAVAAGPVPLTLAALATAEFFAGLGVMIFDVNLNTIQAATIPDGLRSRISGAYSTINYGIRPLGAVAGGALATAIGIRETLLVAAIGGSLSLLPLLLSPIPRVRDLASYHHHATP